MVLSHIFGPVPSRRLGISLGVDIVPSKVCSLDCIYCEAGKTTLLTNERKEYSDVNLVINELDQYLSKKPYLDFITFSGAGEPTLNTGIGKIIKFIKTKYPKYKICLLTNGTLLGKDEMISDLEGLDLIVPSLDAADEETFQKINRPCKGITCSEIIDSLVRFRNKSKTTLWLEIFVVPGINDSQDSIKAFGTVVGKIRPDKIQLNSLDRPGTESWVKKAEYEILLKFRDELSNVAPVEIVGKYTASTDGKNNILDEDLGSRIIDMILRRPCTTTDLAQALSAPHEKILQAIEKLKAGNKVIAEKMPRGIFYKVKENIASLS